MTISGIGGSSSAAPVSPGSRRTDDPLGTSTESPIAGGGFANRTSASVPPPRQEFRSPLPPEYGVASSSSSSQPPGYTTTGAPGLAILPPQLQAMFEGGGMGPTPPSTAEGDIYAAVACRLMMLADSGDPRASTLLAYATQDQRPLTTMSGQIAAAHGLVAAFSNIAGSTEQVLVAVKKVIVPLERAMVEVEKLIPEVARNSGLRHKIRKALMREMNPVKRTVPELYGRMTQRSTTAAIFRNSPFKSAKFAEKILAYSGHGPFPGMVEGDMIIRHAVDQAVSDESKRPMVFEQLDAQRDLARNPRHERNPHFKKMDYNGESYSFNSSYLPAHTLRNMAELSPAFGNRMVEQDRNTYLPPVYAGIAALVNHAEQLLPPTGNELSDAVHKACKGKLTQGQREGLRIGLRNAMKDRSPAELVQLARRAGVAAGAPEGWSVDPVPPYPGPVVT
jgi:hypothetical protein